MGLIDIAKIYTPILLNSPDSSKIISAVAGYNNTAIITENSAYLCGDNSGDQLNYKGIKKLNRKRIKYSTKFIEFQIENEKITRFFLGGYHANCSTRSGKWYIWGGTGYSRSDIPLKLTELIVPGAIIKNIIPGNRWSSIDTDQGWYNSVLFVESTKKKNVVVKIDKGIEDSVYILASHERSIMITENLNIYYKDYYFKPYYSVPIKLPGKIAMNIKYWNQYNHRLASKRL